MTKYAKLKTMKDNFSKAASMARSNDMIALWVTRAEDVQKQMDEMTLEEASKEVE